MIYFLKHLFHIKGIPYRYDQIFTEVKRIRPKNIMEIGVWTGERARKMINIASSFHPKDLIHYYGFDLFEIMDKEKYNSEISKQPPSLSEVQSKLDLTGANIHLYKGDTINTLPELDNNLPYMDFIFIDGGHSLDTIANDWHYASKLMKKGSVAIFDDYWPNRIDAGSKKTVDSIDKNNFIVDILPVTDFFEKTEFGPLTIQLARVVRI